MIIQFESQFAERTDCVLLSAV